MLGKKAGGQTVKVGATGICSKSTGRNHAPETVQRASLGLGGKGEHFIKGLCLLHFKGVRSGSLERGSLFRVNSLSVWGLRGSRECKPLDNGLRVLIDFKAWQREASW